MKDRLINLIAEQFNVDKDSITLDTSFKDDLNADSLDLVELIMALEDEFDLELEDENIDNIQTVNNVITYIEKLTLDI